MLIVSIIQLVKQVNEYDNDDDNETTTASALFNLRIATWLLILYILPFQGMGATLLFYHCKFSAKNITTYGYLKPQKGHNYHF